MKRRQNGSYLWIGILCSVLLIVTIIVLFATQKNQLSSINLDITLRPLSTLFPFDDQLYFAYELLVLNLHTTQTLDILALQIFDISNNKLLTELKDVPIHFFYENNTRILTTITTTHLIIKAVIYVFIAFPVNRTLPDALKHIIITPDHKIIVSTPIVHVPTGLSPIIGSPFKEERTWFVAGGPAPDSLHRTTVLPVPGKLFLAQKYAIDFISLDEHNRSFINNGTQNSDWDCYNRQLVAVADGRVIFLQDGIPDNFPGLSPIIEITGSTIIGNSIVLQIAPTTYVFYAHLVPGSLLVSIGQQISKGQIIARLGNSGNSMVPHLHLHIANSSILLESEGIAYVFDHFLYLGNTEIAGIFNGGNALSPFIFISSNMTTSQQLKIAELPLQYSIVFFDSVTT